MYFKTLSNTIHTKSAIGLIVASIELTNPPKLNKIKNGTVAIFAMIEYVLKVLK